MAAGRDLDLKAQTHQYADMRTTIDLPDEVYRTLKARAAFRGTTLKDLVQQLIEQALSQADGPERSNKTRPPLPVIIPSTGVPLPALSPEELGKFEEEEDLERLAGSDRR
jgi:hypothetical protein